MVSSSLRSKHDCRLKLDTVLLHGLRSGQRTVVVKSAILKFLRGLRHQLGVRAVSLWTLKMSVPRFDDAMNIIYIRKISSYPGSCNNPEGSK